jgi:hypothetical protein
MNHAGRSLSVIAQLVLPCFLFPSVVPFFFQNANQLQVKYSYRSGGNTGPRTFSLGAVLFH